MANSTGEIPSYLGIYPDLSSLPHESTLLQNSHFREKSGTDRPAQIPMDVSLPSMSSVNSLQVI